MQQNLLGGIKADGSCRWISFITRIHDISALAHGEKLCG
jgi:hypothetical protein